MESKQKIPSAVYFLLSAQMFLCICTIILVGAVLTYEERSDRRFRFVAEEIMKGMDEDDGGRWTEAEKADIRAQLGID